MNKHTSFLIIGAGPFGLATAAYAQAHGMDYLVVGKIMSAWKENMPRGMCLRSDTNWHLDPLDEYTFKRYVATLGKTPEEVLPVKLEFYLDYVNWFIEKRQLNIQDLWVEKLDVNENGIFEVSFGDGSIITADKVLLAIGFGYFSHIPPNLAMLLPVDRYMHTKNLKEPSDKRGKRLLMIGGRQSAYESTALLQEAGAAEIHVCHRHEKPLFTESHWDWVQPIIDRVKDEPGWYRNLSEKERNDLNHKFWVEGRRKLEPWLAARIHKPNVHIWEKANMISCNQLEDSSLEIGIDTGEKIIVDEVIFATGYQVDMYRISFMRNGNILSRLKQKNGYPVLDVNFQTSIPNLYISSMPALQDFGLFFAFTLSAITSAEIIGRKVRET